MITQDVKRLLAKALFSLAILAIVPAAPPAHATTPPSWKDNGFSINASGMRLRDVFEEFGRTYAVRVSYGLKADEMAREMRAACLGMVTRPARAVFDRVYAEPHSGLQRERDEYAAYLATFEEA